MFSYSIARVRSHVAAAHNNNASTVQWLTDMGRFTRDLKVACSITGHSAFTSMCHSYSIGTIQMAATPCGWGGNRGPGENYWQPPLNARVHVGLYMTTVTCGLPA